MPYPHTHCDVGWCSTCRGWLLPDAPTEAKVAALAALATGSITLQTLPALHGLPLVEHSSGMVERVLNYEPLLTGTPHEVGCLSPPGLMHCGPHMPHPLRPSLHTKQHTSGWAFPCPFIPLAVFCLNCGSFSNHPPLQATPQALLQQIQTLHILVRGAHARGCKSNSFSPAGLCLP